MKLELIIHFNFSLARRIGNAKQATPNTRASIRKISDLRPQDSAIFQPMQIRRPLLYGLTSLGLGALIFLMASAFLVERGSPRWLAGLVGVVAFPVAPLGWHLVAERRRKQRLAAAKTPPKTAMTAGDRFKLRFAASTLLILSPMFAIGGLRVIGATWRQRAWFMPQSAADSAATAGALLRLVPADAELVAIFRDDAGASKTKRGIGVVGYANHRVVAIVPDDGFVNDAVSATAMNQQLRNFDFLALEPVGEMSGVQRGTRVLISPSWRSQLAAAERTPAAALTELARAPATAKLAVGYVPAEPAAEFGLKRAAGWAIATEAGFELQAHLQLTDVTAGDQLLRELSARWLAKTNHGSDECRTKMAALASSVKVDRNGTDLSVHLTLSTEALTGLVVCNLGNLPADAE